MKRFLCTLSLLLTLAGAATADKRAFRLDDLYRLKAIGDPQVSPDGRTVAFVVTESDLTAGKTNSDLYRVGADGSGLCRLTSTEGEDIHPRWSPDGNTLMFISSRKDGSQIWLLPTTGGEARQLTSLSTGISDPIWSPDGKKILFASDVFPECGADDAGNKKIQEAMDKGPLHAHMADRLLYRHWTSWADGKRSHLLLVDVATGKVADLTPGDFDSPPFSLGGQGFTFSPDGTEVCFVSKRVIDEASSTNDDLWLVPATGGEPHNLTPDNPAYDGDPQYSPDGRYIAYRLQRIPTFEADRFRLALIDRQTGERRILTEAFDNWVDGFQWAPDSRSIVFSAQERGRYPFYRVDVPSGMTRLLLPGAEAKSVRGFHLAPDGRWLAFCRSAVGEPLELFRADLERGSAERLTALNQAVADEVDIRPAEEIWVKGAGGADIHVFIVKPHNFDPGKKYPLILNVHGGPQMQWADSFRGDWQVYPGAGYVVAFPNPHGSTGYGQAFTDAISRDWGGRVMEDVLKVSEALAALPFVDAGRMGAMGWSWGGYAMMWLEGHPNRFKALASMMGVYDLRAMHGATEELWFPEYDLGGAPWESTIYEQDSPAALVRNFKTPCLVITGERDYRVPYTQSLHFFTDLQKMKVPSRLIVFENDGHWPSGIKSMPFYYNAHLDWFHRFLGGEPPPYDMIRMWRNQAYETQK